MITIDTLCDPAGPNDLRELQLRVARRADQLARRTLWSRATDRSLWLRAECEVFEQWETAGEAWSERAAGSALKWVA